MHVDFNSDELEMLAAVVRVVKDRSVFRKDPRYMFVSRGVVQFMDRDGQRGPVLAFDRESASAFLASARKDGYTMSIAEIGAIHGETLDGQIRCSIDTQGANGAWFMVDDKSMYFREISPPPAVA